MEKKDGYRLRLNQEQAVEFGETIGEELVVFLKNGTDGRPAMDKDGHFIAKYGYIYMGESFSLDGEQSDKIAESFMKHNFPQEPGAF